MEHVSDKSIAESGKENREFSTGAVRDNATGKGAPVLISPYFIDRLAKHLEKGAIKYESRNWEKGIPLSECMNSLLRHITSLIKGNEDEDHCAAAICNLMFYLHIKEMIEQGKLPDTLDDMPNYEKQL